MKIKSGIYKIVNLVNNKIYVGSAINLYNRKKNHKHFLLINNHHNKHLQLAYNKYGKDNFKFEVIEYIEDKIKLLDKEQYWIDKLDACNLNIGYNTRLIAESNLGFKHSDETKYKISKSLIGKKYPNRIKRKNIKHSKETKIKISKNSPCKKKIVNIDTGEIFKSIIDASNKYRISASNISKVCLNTRKTCGGYRWSFYDK